MAIWHCQVVVTIVGTEEQVQCSAVQCWQGHHSVSRPTSVYPIQLGDQKYSAVVRMVLREVVRGDMADPWLPGLTSFMQASSA